MVPETPPRRSRSTKEPVTIDLTAEEVGLVAEPVRSNDTDEPETAEGRKTSRAPEDADTAAASAEAADEKSPAASGLTDEPLSATDAPPAEAPFSGEPLSTEHAFSGTDETAQEKDGFTAGEAPEPKPDLASEAKSRGADEPEKSAATETAHSEQPAFDEPSEPKPAAEDQPTYRATPDPFTAAPSPEPQRQSPTTSTLIAAGIAGGIVALLLAGSMQYAGYLPGAKPATDVAPAADTSALSSEIAGLRQEVEALRNQPPAAASGAPDSGLSDQIQALQSQIAAMKSASDAAATAEQGLSRRLAEAEAKINDRGPEQQVARAVAAAALKAAIDRGGTFQTELDTFASVAGNDPAIQQLQPFATRGVPSRISLQQEFPRVADAMLEAANQPNPDASIADRLMSSALSVVKVRKVGDVPGDTPEAKVARVENALQNGDLAAASREWVALPDASKAIAGDFKQRLDARIQVENLVGGTLTRAVTGSNG